jgi:hypothetical protein
MPARKRQFLTSTAPPTAPTAATAPVAENKTPRRLEASKPAAAPSRSAFTWRRTADQALAMDEMTLRLKRELGRPKLDHAQILAALVEIATDSPAVYGALVARLQVNDV